MCQCYVCGARKYPCLDCFARHAGPTENLCSLNHSGIDRVDTDALGSQLYSRTPGQLIHSRLGHFVGYGPWVGAQASYARNIHHSLVGQHQFCLKITSI